MRTNSTDTRALSSPVAVILLLGATIVLVVLVQQFLFGTVQEATDRPAESEVSVSTSRAGAVKFTLLSNPPDKLVLEANGVSKTITDPEVGQTYVLQPDDDNPVITVIAEGDSGERVVVKNKQMLIDVDNFTPLSQVSSPHIQANPDDTGAKSTHRAYVKISGSGTVGSSLLHFRVDYSVSGSTAPDLSNLDISDIQAVGIDRDGDGDIDVNTLDDLDSVSVSNGEVLLDWGGSYGIQSDDYLILKFDDIKNPTSAGDHDVDFITNEDSANYKVTGTIKYEE